MKKIVHYFSVFSILLTLAERSTAQTNDALPNSIITIVRSGSFVGSACRTDITLPNQRQINLPLKSVIDYTVYSEGEIQVTVEINCPAAGYNSPSSTSKQVTLNVKRGGQYYVFYSAGAFKEATKEDVQENIDKIKNKQKHTENLEYPINKSSLANLKQKESISQSTCFLISKDGYLITNYHCIENTTELVVRGINGDYTTKYAATVIASDPSNDLSILKLSNTTLKFNDLPFALKTTGVNQAEKVYALGYPYIGAMGEEMKITEGIISAKSGAQGDISKFQISAAVNHGNSGGPLFDEEGNLIGVIYAKSTVAESAGYAIKASYLDSFLKNIDGFIYPTYINTIKGKSLTDRTSELKNYIYILETK